MNQRQLKRRTVRKQTYGTFHRRHLRCGRCGAREAHYVYLPSSFGGDASVVGFWTCSDLYDESGRRKEPEDFGAHLARTARSVFAVLASAQPNNRTCK